METAAFLRSVVTSPEGWFCMLVGPPTGKDDWHEEWYRWPADVDDIVKRTEEASTDNNVYFSAHLFSEQKSTRANVLPSKTIQVDIDEGDINYTVAPTVLVQTSPGRHQGYWVMNDMMDPDFLEVMSRKLTYSIPDCDKHCWQLGHKMRLPGSINHKYSTPHTVKVVNNTLNVYKTLPLTIANVAIENEILEAWGPHDLDIGPRELLAQVRSSLPSRVVSQYDRRAPDRSDALWALMSSCFRAGLDRDQVFLLAKHSANNKFNDSKYHADRDLAKDVLRAERVTQRGEATDVRGKIAEARRLPGVASEKRQYIAHMVFESLKERGNFISTSDGQDWYVREDTGRPIGLAMRSDHLASLLEYSYGLNSTEAEQRFVIANLITNSKEKGQQGITAHLSYYNVPAETVLLHSGRRDVLAINSHDISITPNGQMGILFPWDMSLPFDPDISHPASLDTLFEDCFDNVLDMSKDEAKALLKTWFLFLFFRDSVITRPILALFGQPGSGKSTLFRRIYVLLYGSTKALNSITTADDFDHAVANDPLVVFDNVDTWTSWLPDKLALSASTSDLVKRKLYTDTDIVVLKRQALIGLTAHNPKFRREDIVDRLLLLNFQRLKEFKPETEILAGITQYRDAIWGDVVKSIQKTLGTPVPAESDIPQFRINDFARVGLRIARALGYEDDFRNALGKNVTSQKQFNLEEEDVLIDAVRSWHLVTKQGDAFHPVSELWGSWQNCARDPQEFVRLYKNAVNLGKKLWSLQDSLKSVFATEHVYDSERNIRLWKVSPK